MPENDETAAWTALLADTQSSRTECKALIKRVCLDSGKRLHDLLQDPSRQDDLDLSDSLSDGLSRSRGRLAAERQRLDSLQSRNIQVLRRDEPAYPDSLTGRLGEDWLPYVFYYQGSLTLTTEPATTVLGSSAPAPEALGLSQELGRSLAADGGHLTSHFGPGIARACVQATLGASGQAVVILPLGLGRFAGDERGLGDNVASGDLLLISPYAPDQPATQSLALASELLVAANAETIVLVDPDYSPDERQWSQHLATWGTPFWIWQGSCMPYREAWLNLGAQPFSKVGDIAHLEGHTLAASSPSSKDLTPGESIQLDEPFASADEALDTLGLGGNVPDILARRIRRQYDQTDPDEQ